MKKRSISRIRREYDAPDGDVRGGFHPLASSRYWFQQALRAVAIVRREVVERGLTEKHAPADPYLLFQQWFQDAIQAKVLDPNAMTLATSSPTGKPTTRIVLLKDFDARGFVFYTNYHSRKGIELAKVPFASLLFFWPNLMRQVRVDGKVVKVSAKESDDYFNSRPRGSQISAWASNQSGVVAGRETLVGQMKFYEKKFQGQAVPRPPHWGGYRVDPNLIEFWSGRPNRLHDRIQYLKAGREGWKIERLSP